MLLTLYILKDWHNHHVFFIKLHPKALFEFDLYMDLPHGVEKKEGSNKMHVLKLPKKMYVQKQAGKVWNQYLVSGLTKIVFLVSAGDEWVLYQGHVIFFNYVDGKVFLSLD